MKKTKIKTKCEEDKIKIVQQLTEESIVYGYRSFNGTQLIPACKVEFEGPSYLLSTTFELLGYFGYIWIHSYLDSHTTRSNATQENVFNEVRSLVKWRE